ncbi:MAG: hypothetical protein JO150_16780, partial [Acidobacteriaceae bacterium]|nr:hypothetical protein [Acidobacteriaceae bacterium]
MGESLSASNAQSYERAVKIMLDALGDPMTTIIKQDPPSPGSDGAITAKWETGSILMITVPDSEDWNGMIEQLGKLSGDIPKARAVVFDLRAAHSWAFVYSLRMSSLEGSFSSRPITMPAHRTRLHSGLVSITETSGGYYSGFQVTDSRQIRPKPGAKDVPVVFVVSEQSAIPEMAFALQIAGNGRIVSEGPITDDSLVRTTHVPLTRLSMWNDLDPPT